MKAVFVESSEFTRWVTQYLDDETYTALQQELMDNPQLGDVIPGCGGLRKVRFRDPRRAKGKRGGIRVIYLFVVEPSRFYLLDIFDKDEKIDLTSTERRELARLAATLKSEAKMSMKQKEKEP